LYVPTGHAMGCDELLGQYEPIGQLNCVGAVALITQ
jgi:hypothetical protein